MPLPDHLRPYWQTFAAATGLGDESRFYEAFAFGDNEDMASELAGLVLSGVKRATASSAWACDASGKPHPKPGDLSIVTSWQGQPLCVIETQSVEVVAFDQVPQAFATAEGEGDLSLAFWRAAHQAYFERTCALIGRAFTPDMPVVCERFRLVYASPHLSPGPRQDTRPDTQPDTRPAPRPDTLFHAIGGADGVLRLAHAWHARVLADDVVAHAFSHGFHPQHTQRLAAYWAEAWGGPAHYSQGMGTESAVVRMHSGNGDHHEMDRRAITCFDQAMDDIQLADPPLRQALHDYFVWTTTKTMAAYPASKHDVPEGLQMPRWSWTGLQT